MRPAAGLIAAAAAVTAAMAARRSLDVVEIRGRSMLPTLLPGDRLLIVRAAPRPGDVVVAPDPREPGRELIKRLRSVEGDSAVLRGDNPAASTDARTFGSVRTGDIAWRGLVRYWPPRRAGRIPPAPLDIDVGGEPACAFPEALVAGGVGDDRSSVRES
jgi:nickel-type superoxide dismutase maturation protease